MEPGIYFTSNSVAGILYDLEETEVALRTMSDTIDHIYFSDQLLTLNLMETLNIEVLPQELIGKIFQFAKRFSKISSELTIVSTGQLARY